VAANRGGPGTAGGVMANDIRVHIRWMIRRDMREVLAIEATNFGQPWGEEDFLKVLRQRNSIGMVAEYGERVVGFMIYELHADSLNVLNIAVDTDHQRRRVGSQLVAKMVAKLASHRRTALTLSVCDRNLSAQLFFRRMGFKAERVVRGYYESSGDDAYVMAYRLRETSHAT
jgi:[ribosomal protein S18]-alanine N-acetyltransferase